MQKSVKRGTLTAEELEECQRLKRAWSEFQHQEREAGRHWTQESMAESLGWTQSNFSHYVNGRQALNLENLLAISNRLGIDPASISPRLTAAIPPLGDDLAAMLNDLPADTRNGALDSLELALRRAQSSLLGDNFTRYMRLLDRLRGPSR